MSENKKFVSMVNMINDIGEETYDIRESLNDYLNMVESIDLAESQEEDLDEAEGEMSKELEDKREEYVLELKKKADYFKKRYGDDWENVMYGTATNLAKKDLGMD